jgi:hypothetical protein
MRKMVKIFRIPLIICLITGIGLFGYFFHLQPAKSADTDNISGWAWSETIGWISFNCTNTGVCGTSDYGVNVDSGTGDFSGYAWSENIGWINFAPGGPYPAAPNYSANFSSASGRVRGWARAVICETNPVDCDGWDGWIKLGDDSGIWDTNPDTQVYIESGTNEFHSWAWGDDIVGWISFNCSDTGICGTSDYKVIVGAGGVNFAPEATNLSKTDPDWCGSPPSYFFSWTYSDVDGDDESRFDFQVDNNSDFSSPEVDRTYTGLSNPSPSQNNQTVLVAVSQLPDYLTYNSTTYFWRVRVWDSRGADSGWVQAGSSFTTQAHAWPNPDFVWIPDPPVPKEGVQFTDQSTCYDNVSIGSSCNENDPNPALSDSFSWTFQDANPPNSGIQNPTTTFLTTGIKQVVLTVTDSDGYSCPLTKNITISLPLPKWKEIKPW